ncbi:hypothetical protein GW17_00032641 [Ensete ventricosum]|nr:hypothetical protein GW17_00032641 [Ensete ventricosum]
MWPSQTGCWTGVPSMRLCMLLLLTPSQTRSGQMWRFEIKKTVLVRRSSSPSPPGAWPPEAATASPVPPLAVLSSEMYGRKDEKKRVGEGPRQKRNGIPRQHTRSLGAQGTAVATILPKIMY